MKRRILLYRLFYMVFCIILSCNDQKTTSKKEESIRVGKLEEIDGPYIFRENDSLTVFTVKKEKDANHYLDIEKFQKTTEHQFICEVSNTDNDLFSFSLMNDYHISKALYEDQEKIFVTSDIEGNFNAFYSLLVGNQIMDKTFNWTFGKGHLVIAGDMVDRGKNVLPCLWLLYKLEKEAEKAGGKVHYILGNHDVMTMHANVRYVKSKYIELAKIISGDEDKKEAYKYLFSDRNELAKWIASKNTIEKIGNTLFVHAGVSEDIIDAGLSIDHINTAVRKNIRINLTSNPGNDDYANLIFGRKGPLWYRGLVKDYKDYYKKMSNDNLDAVLDHFEVDRIVIGHTIIDKEVTSDYNGKVIRVGIKHPSEKFSGASQALLIEKDTLYKVNDSGDRFNLEPAD